MTDGREASGGKGAAGRPFHHLANSAAIDLCHRELVLAEEALTAGHPDVEGPCLSIVGWNAEFRQVRAEEGGDGA